MTRILITGAAGFIGSHLTERLLAGGATVLGLDNFADTYDPQLKRRNIATALRDERFELAEADVRAAGAIDETVERFRPRVIVHLAALAGVRASIQRPSLYTAVNVLGTSHVLDAAVKHRVEKFIFGSSSSVYGDNPKVPFSETDRIDRPISPYAASKRAAELIAHTYWHIHRLPVTCLRFFTVYGPRQRPDLAIHKFMTRIAAGQPIQVFGDGSTSRDYTYVGDIVDGVVAAIDRCDGFDTINLGSHRPITLMDLIHAVERTVGRPAKLDRQPMQPGDVERTYADITHAAERLGYRPKVALEEGLAEQWAWLRAAMTPAVGE